MPITYCAGAKPITFVKTKAELTIQPFETLPSANGLPPAPPPLESEPRHQRLARLTREHERVTEALRDLKRDWATKNVRAQATRTPIATSEVTHVENRRRELAGELLRIQTAIGATNKEIRSQKPSRLANSRERARRELEQRHFDFLTMFHMVVRDSVDPRQFRAFEDGAKALLEEAREMGIEAPEAR